MVKSNSQMGISKIGVSINRIINDKYSDQISSEILSRRLFAKFFTQFQSSILLNKNQDYYTDSKIHINFKENKINLSLSYKIKQFMLSLFLLILLVMNIFKTPKKYESNVEIYYVSKGNFTKNIFREIQKIDNPKNSTIKILNDLDFRISDKNIKNVFLTRYIELFVFSNFLPIRVKVKVISKIIKKILLSFIEYTNLITTKEFIFDQEIWKAYSDFGSGTITKVVTSQSKLITLPIANYFLNSEVKRIMYWYSSNSLKFMRKNGEIDDYGYPKGIWKRYIDFHLVPTRQLRNHIELNIEADLDFIIEPKILLTELERKKTRVYIGEIDVLIFDVPPQSQYKDSTYYSNERLELFLESLIKVRSNISRDFSTNPVFALKSKRKFNKNFHSNEYQKLLQTYNSDKNLLFFNHDVNVQELIVKAKVVIGVPFTTPVEISRLLNVPCAFYSPEVRKESWIIKKEMSEIPILFNYEQLEKFIITQLFINQRSKRF